MSAQSIEGQSEPQSASSAQELGADADVSGVVAPALAAPHGVQVASAIEKPVERNLVATEGSVTVAERAKRLGQRPCTLWLTGLSAAGKTTIAHKLERVLFEAGYAVYVIDGDHLRHGLSSDLGFSAADRTENIRRVAEVARLMNDAGLVVVTAFISPFREDRAKARAVVGAGRFFEVFVDAPLEICVTRDPKGLYARALDGRIANFTGVSSPYEAPDSPELSLPTHELSSTVCVERIVEMMRERGVLSAT